MGSLKMIPARTFAAPARQCVRTASPRSSWIPAFSQVRLPLELRDFSNALETALTTSYQVQTRSYAIPKEEKVAKFKGKKGSDVWIAPFDVHIGGRHW